MKIAIGCLLLSMGVGITASAQESRVEIPAAEASQSTSPLAGWTFGILGGWDENTPVISLPQYAEDMKYLKNSGLSLGISAKYALTNWLYCRADVLWVQKNYKMNRTAYNSSSILNSEYTNDYLSVPLMAMVSFGYDFRVFAYFGGYVGYWLSGHRKGNTYSMDYLLYLDLSSTEYDQDWEFDSNRDNRFDAGLVFGGGFAYTFMHHFEVSAEARYYYGMTDVQKGYMENNNIPHYNSTLAITAGVAYKF